MRCERVLWLTDGKGRRLAPEARSDEDGERARAEPDGVIDRVMAPAGTQVEVKDLLVVFG